MLRVLGGGGDTGKAYAPRDEQRARADRVAQEYALERALSHDPRTR